MKLTNEVLFKLGFENKGRIWSKYKLDLHEDEIGIFSFNEGRIYFDVETVDELHTLWKVIKAESDMPLPLNKLSKGLPHYK